MGTLRLILSLFVLARHTSHSGWPYESELHPMHIFYILAGFYAFISLSRSENRGALSNRAYYLGRFLRLYPVFIISVVLTLAWSFFYPVENFGYNPRSGLAYASQSLSTPAKTLLWTPNFTLAGTDLPAMFNLVDGERLEIAGADDASSGRRPENRYWLQDTLIIPASFALGLMCWFYLLAPAVVRGGKLAKPVAAGVASYALYWIFGSLFAYGGYFVWIFWFWLFALGIISGQAYLKWKDKIRQWIDGTWVARAIPLAVCGFFLLTLGGGFPLAEKSAEVLIAGALPFLAIATRKSSVDNFLGLMAYPLFCSSGLAISGSSFLAQAGMLEEGHRLLFSLAISIPYAVAMVFLVEKPVAAIRQKLKVSHLSFPAPAEGRLVVTPSGPASP